eukprot:3242227-Rhodomonas_salina.1
MGTTRGSAFGYNARESDMRSMLAGTAAGFPGNPYGQCRGFVANTAADLMPGARYGMSKRAKSATAAEFAGADGRYTSERELPFTRSQYMSMPRTSADMSRRSCMDMGMDPGRYVGPVGDGQLASSAQLYADDLAALFARLSEDSRLAGTSDRFDDEGPEGDGLHKCACCGEHFVPWQ